MSGEAQQTQTHTPQQSVAVVVHGDLGHSPRMQNHCRCLLAAGLAVDFVGYTESPLPPALADNPNLRVRPMPEFPIRLPRWLLPVYGPFKVLWMLLTLLRILVLVIPRPSHVLVQNPPAIPTLMGARLACWLRGASLVVDWHNFGYTILALSLPSSLSWAILPVAKLYERFWGGLADAHFCVTAAMSHWLEENWNIRGARVLYDRPSEVFDANLSVEEQHNVLTKYNHLGATNSFTAVAAVPTKGRRKSSTVAARFEPNRAGLVVSSTSYTPDEDLSILIDAGIIYDQVVEKQTDSQLPDLVFVITGKGPQKQMYADRIASLDLAHVSFVQAWLDIEDYPRLLACCDLGISLHYSSSGLDLPMKVVDMFGSGLPVCALNFNCIGELVTEETGRLFSFGEGGDEERRSAASGELASHLMELFSDFDPTKSDDTTQLGRLRAVVQRGDAFQGEPDWEAMWARVGAPVFGL